MGVVPKTCSIRAGSEEKRHSEAVRALRVAPLGAKQNEVEGTAEIAFSAEASRELHEEAFLLEGTHESTRLCERHETSGVSSGSGVADRSLQERFGHHGVTSWDATNPRSSSFK
jgi:hypothetical protein